MQWYICTALAGCQNLIFFLGKVHTLIKKMCYSTLTSLGEVRVALVTLVAHADVAGGTTTEQAFVPGHLSRQPLGPGQ